MVKKGESLRSRLDLVNCIAAFCCSGIVNAYFNAGCNYGYFFNC